MRQFGQPYTTQRGEAAHNASHVSSQAAEDLGVVDPVRIVEHQNILLLGQELLDGAFYFR